MKDWMCGQMTRRVCWRVGSRFQIEGGILEDIESFDTLNAEIESYS
jgi:hypothetical protein